MSSPQETFALFAYAPEEQKTFPYLSEYMRRVEPERARIAADPAMLERYMLAGLFLTWRACRHSGSPMSTVGAPAEPLPYRRLAAYKQLTGKDIRDDADYLRRIRYRFWKPWVLGPGNMLFRFVMQGR